MSKISQKRREFEIKLRQKRKKKIKKLKEKYKATKTEEEKEKILEKLQKIAPHYPVEEFLNWKRNEKVFFKTSQKRKIGF